MIGAAAAADEAVRAHLENVKLYGDVCLPPRQEHVNRPAEADRLVIRADGEKQRRSAGRRGIAVGVGGINPDKEVRARFRRAFGGADDDRTAGRISDHSDSIGLKAVPGCVLTENANGLLTISGG
jgi:hypothetical protein